MSREDVLELVRDAVEQLRLARSPLAGGVVRLPSDPSSEAHRAELGFLVELIGARLRTPLPKPAKYNEDNPWFWRTAFRGREVPGDIEELVAGHYERHEFEKAEVIFRLLVDAFDDYS